MRRIVTLAAVIALAAGVASAPDPAKTVGTTTTLDVTKSEIGTPPPDFDFLQTGEGEPGRWTVVRDVTAIARDRNRTCQYRPAREPLLACDLRTRFHQRLQAERSLQDHEGNDAGRGDCRPLSGC